MIVPPVDLNSILRFLTRQWLAETAHFSTERHKVINKRYQRIIGFGPVALPFILGQVAEGEIFWFWALEAISGENPAEDATNVAEAQSAWIEWGRQRGLVP